MRELELEVIRVTSKKAKPTQPSSVEPRATRPDFAGILDAVMDVSRKQAQIISEMRTALENGNDDRALEKARELVGLPSKPSRDSRRKPRC